MRPVLRFLPVSLNAFLVELPSLNETLSLFSILQAKPLCGMREILPAARTVLISFAPHETSAAVLAGQISRLHLNTDTRQTGPCVEVPVDYNGDDLPEVAELTGLTVEEVIRRHTERDYVVAFCGFAPGFGYLTGGDPALRVPRRTTPRTHLPAGAVGLAGEFTGVYPRVSPGGWQIIGTTPVKMWDLARTPSAFFQPGYQVRFIDSAKAKQPFYLPPVLEPAHKIQDETAHDGAFVVLAAPLPALFQDLGRFGQTGQGVSSAGALDRGSFKAANRLVGNDVSEPCLELTGGGFTFRSLAQAVVAFTGAPCDLGIRTATGRCLAPAFYGPLALEPGDEVTLSAPKAGARSYMSVRGGFAVETILGSAATDTLAGIGPAPVRAGDKLVAKPQEGFQPVSLFEAPALSFPKAGDIVALDIVLGPRADWFTPDSLGSLSQVAWEVTARSNRVGVRLAAQAALVRANAAELPSEGCVAGALEVPPDGKPLLLLADHPLTGGYPVVGTVADYHLDLAGQIPVGAFIRFRPLAAFTDITPDFAAA